MNNDPVIKRAWCMPNHDTFSMPPVSAIIGRYIGLGGFVDPFARNSQFKRYCLATNDLSPEADTTHHMEALDFLRLFDDESVNGVLFDPPYSPRQIAECYKNAGMAVHMSDTQSSFYGDRKREAARIVKHGGIAICCGWNSGGLGEGNGFHLIEVLLCAHGGAHNDTIITVEKKATDLFSRIATNNAI